MPGMNLKQRLAAADQRVAELLGELTDPATPRERFGEAIKDYVLCKYLLDADEYISEVIFDLAEASIEKMLRLNDRSVKLAVASTTCTNQSSTDIKKVLLSLSLQRALHVTMTPDESAGIETVPQLADALYRRMHR